MSGILNNTREVTLAGESVTFRELRAVDGIEFLKRLSKYASGMKSSQAEDYTSKLTEIIVGAEDVSTFLVLKASSKGSEWLDKISATEFLEALQIAIDLNITDTFIKKAQGVAASIKSRMHGTTPSASLPGESNS